MSTIRPTHPEDDTRTVGAATPERPSSPDPAGAEGGGPPIGTTRLEPTYRLDLRTGPPDVFEDLSATDWSRLGWSDVGRPHRVDPAASERREWEERHGREMPVPEQWSRFNRHFHRLFVSDEEDRQEARRRFLGRAARLRLGGALETAGELLRLKVWNLVHRVEDAVWDPRGKRALFEGLELDRPRILFLGAAEGYEAMQLMAQYPGGSAVLVDYDSFCETERFGNFPESYPFLGRNPATGSWDVYRRSDFAIDYLVADIRDLDFGREFDVVLSVGLIEHFPDEHKPLVMEFHRKFLKPGGVAVMTTPLLQWRSRAFYRLMNDLLNFSYRELMTPEQLGLYAWEAGFEVLRCGMIKAHNGVIARPR